MKFWELVSVCRNNPELLAATLQDERWSDFMDLHASFSMLIQQRNRQRLDTKVPDALCCEVLGGIFGKLFLSKSGTLRSQSLGHDEHALDYLEVFHAFGGSTLEEVLEKGSKKVRPPN